MIFYITYNDKTSPVCESLFTCLSVDLSLCLSIFVFGFVCNFYICQVSSFPFVIMSVYHARLVCHHVYLSSYNVIMSICICHYVRLGLSSSVFHHVHLSQCPSVITPVCHHARLSSCSFVITQRHHVYQSCPLVTMSVYHHA